MKILFVSSIDQHILRFHLPTIKWLHEIGCEVHVACSGGDPIPYCKEKHKIDFIRLPFAIRNIVSYFQLKRVIKNNNFDIVHCNTAVAAIITKFACRNFRKNGLKVFYTAHGFHFFKGSPWHYWFIYYPAERISSRWLDCQITINREDYELAKAKFFCKDVQLIPGMGADPIRFKKLSPGERAFHRKNLGIPEGAKVLIYTAEFTPIKNHADLIHAVARLRLLVPNLIVLLLGRGMLLKKTSELAETLGVYDIVRFLGFRNDVNILMGVSDISVSTSKREGLGLHLVESLMTGLPVVVSDNRGHREFVKDGENGFFFEKGDFDKFCELACKLLNDEATYSRISNTAINSVEHFSLENSLNSIKEIYKGYLGKK